VDRISEACSGLNFRNPQPVEGRKLHHLSTLIEEGAKSRSERFMSFDKALRSCGS
jgi:hypothetical protein